MADKTLGIIGKKLGMTQVFQDNGTVQAVTAIEAGPCTVVSVKTSAKDGYNAAKLGFGEPKLPKSRQGQAKGEKAYRYLREFRLDDASNIKAGQSVDVSLFKPGDLVDVIGISKGKGFAGGVKRYHFAGGPKTHGQSDRHRAPGSVGSGTTPGRVYKGLRMAGRIGQDRVTARNLEVFQADPERKLLVVKGAVPGMVSGLLLVKKSVKRK